jgi:hypothetical protein
MFDVFQHGDDAKLVTGGSDVRASIILWRKVGVFVHLLVHVSQCMHGCG